MYSVSNDYLDKITSSSREVSWYGSIKLASGTIVSFDTSNIASGGLSVNYDVSSDENPSIGNAFAGELRLNLYTDIDRYSLYGAEVTAYFRLYLTENTYEDVPLGVFYISEAERTSNMVSIVAYDGMTKLDSVKVAEDKSGSYPYEWIKAVVERGGLQLGNTSAEIGAMPNGNEQITFTQNSEPITSMSCRDALGYLSAVVCANAFIGRDGKVYIKGYDDAEVATIGADGRFSSSIADYTTRYTAVSLTISSTNATEYYAESTDDGLTFALGTNPFLQSGSSAEHEIVCRSILSGLSVIEYVPYSVGLPVRPELDIMDVLMLTGNQATSSIGAITSLDFSSSGSMNVECTGSNPRLMGIKTKTEKAIDQIQNTVAKEINQMSVVQNSSAVTCGENTETSILTYNFEVTQEENTTMVDVSVVMTSNASETEVNDVYTLSDIVAHLSFYVDGSEVNVYAPEFIVDEGKDTMTFNYSLSGLSVGAHQFDVRLEMDGGSGSIAVGDVHEMLWGYGITFEVYLKNVLLRSLPYNTVYMLNSNIDYTGLEIVGAYNNGTTQDITADCEITPADGTYTEHSGAFEVVAKYVEEQNEYEVSFDALVVSGCFFNENTFKAGMLQTGICVMDDEGNVSSVASLQSITNDHEYINLITSGSDAKKFRFIRNGLASQQYTLTKADGTLTSLGYCGIPGGFVYQYKVESKKYRLVKVIGDYELGVVSEEVLMEINRTDTDYGFIYGTFSQYGVYTGHIIYGFGNHTVTVPNGDSVRTCGFIDTRTGEYRDTDFPISTWPGMVCMDDGSLYALLPYKQDTYPDPTQILVGFYAWLADGTEIKIDMTSDFNLMCHGNTGAATGILRYDEENDCLVAYAISREATGQGYNFKAMKGFVLDLHGNIEREITIPEYIDIPYASGLTDATKVRLALNGSTAQTGVVDGINYYPHWDSQRLLFTEANYFNSEGKNSPMKNIMVNIPCVPSQTNERIVVIDSLYWEDSPNSIVRATV